MSTTFEVYPTVTEVPTLGNLLKVANQKLHDFLQLCHELSAAIERHDIDFWVNPLCIEDGEAIRKQIT
ncbi:hypothetical protein PAECIP111893_01247 [Paenibacillus plantiphilus]|uniref:Heterokaryon incompatibility domain-containing protein n=1 Tax=Paenibacillus plantiphilus TaxID=2905650 RepID=A0ABM9C0S2_9BACL|nr:hypothetical protein [Paenibacillus plantiphilus]CAH1199159.1 hypothetical protein PAECIP111893_01247 [Paenibacillus plantiphilus]